MSMCFISVLVNFKGLFYNKIGIINLEKIKQPTRKERITMKTLNKKDIMSKL